jgi:hypothetical protein
LARKLWWDLPFDIRTTQSQYDARNSDLFGVLHDLQQVHDFTVVYPHKSFCKRGRCKVTHKGKPIYFDENHLTVDATPLLSEDFTRVLRREPAGLQASPSATP